MKTTILTLILTFAVGFQASAQVVLNGRVTDAATAEPLTGAQVVLKSVKGSGAVTDLDGNFTLNTKEKLPLTLVIDFIGYRTQEIDVYDDSEPIDIELSEDVNTLSEVVIIGYGTQKRTQLTGSVTTVKADVLENTRQSTIDGALSGLISGLNVTASSGQPGAESQLRIRGGNSVNASNEPLYVVDGFIYYKDAANSSTGLGAIEGSLNPLATINPSDIESIEVLKDVSATAIYGSRGANGVILITTKKGSLGLENSNISYGYSIGVSRIARKLDLLGASEWARLQKDYFGNKGGYTDAEIAVLGRGTDWQDAVTRDAIQQTHELSINGGTQKNRYAFSANYTDQDGIILNSGFQRYNEHSLFGYTVTPKELWSTIAKWVEDHHGWKVREDWITFIPGVMKGVGSVVNVFVKPDEKVIIQPPVYYPFRLTPQGNEREVVFNPLKRVEGGSYEIDFENLASVADDKCRLLILSNPHNPAGICWSRETLARLADFCYERNIIVISDEIHCDLTLFGNKHIPFATVSDKAAEISITFGAPSKTFNTAGIVNSYAIVPNETLRRRLFKWLDANEFSEPPLFSAIAIIAAFQNGEPWRRQLISYIEDNIRFVEDYLNKYIPGIKALRPQATFLVWLDCRGLHLDHKGLVDLFVNKARLALNDGEMFGKGGEGYMRLNVGAPRALLKKALDQLKDSI